MIFVFPKDMGPRVTNGGMFVGIFGGANWAQISFCMLSLMLIILFHLSIGSPRPIFITTKHSFTAWAEMFHVTVCNFLCMCLLGMVQDIVYKIGLIIASWTFEAVLLWKAC